MPAEVENLSDIVTGMDPVSLKFDTHPRLDWKGHASSHFDDRHSNLRALYGHLLISPYSPGIYKMTYVGQQVYAVSVALLIVFVAEHAGV